MRWSFMMPVHMFAENYCWLCPGLIVYGLFYAHFCQFWKFMMPFLLKLQSPGSRCLVRMVGSVAHWWSSHWQTTSRPFVSTDRSAWIHCTWYGWRCCSCNVRYITQRDTPSRADTILVLKPGSPPTTSKIFSSATDVRTLRGRPESTIIRRRVPVSRIRWSTERRLGYFSAYQGRGIFPAFI
jgi:hypothetical protein